MRVYLLKSIMDLTNKSCLKLSNNIIDWACFRPFIYLFSDDAEMGEKPDESINYLEILKYDLFLIFLRVLSPAIMHGY